MGVNPMRVLVSDHDPRDGTADVRVTSGVDSGRRARGGGDFTTIDLPQSSRREAWARLHAREIGGATFAHVEATVTVADPMSAAVVPLRVPAPGCGNKWSRDAIGAPAFDLNLAKGVRVGHADTGWANHPNIRTPVWDLKHALNAFDGTTQAEDPLLSFDPFDGHGVGTASVLAAAGAPAVADQQLHGICPGATLVPARCANQVLLFSDIELVLALKHFAALQVDVVTISLGGPPTPFLASAVNDLVAADCIVVAAAGQQFPLTPFPAAYRSCIAVAASTENDRPWRYTTATPSVDICAPGHRVCVADFVDKSRQPTTRSGSGTSYATPHVAAAAALWVSHHGREYLRTRYANGPTLQQVFRSIMVWTARVPDPLPPAQPDDATLVDFVVPLTSWRTDRFGAGILDVKAILDHPLPEASAALVRQTPEPVDSFGHAARVIATELGLAGDADAQQLLDNLGIRDEVGGGLRATEVSDVLCSLDARTLSALRFSVSSDALRGKFPKALASVIASRASEPLLDALRTGN